MDFSSHSILWVLLIGLVVGAIAKLLMPGKDPGAGENYVAGWIMSVVGAMILLLLYRLLFRRGA